MFSHQKMSCELSVIGLSTAKISEHAVSAPIPLSIGGVVYK